MIAKTISFSILWQIVVLRFIIYFSSFWYTENSTGRMCPLTYQISLRHAVWGQKNRIRVAVDCTV